VTVEDENTLVIKSAGKRKREDDDGEGCKYIRLERKAPQMLLRKFRLPENAIVSSAITANVKLGFCLWLLRSILHHPRQRQLILLSLEIKETAERRENLWKIMS
jgi:HSP20 family protein